MEVSTALGPPGGFPAKSHSILAMQLCLYQSPWQQHDVLLYYLMQLYVLAASGGRTEMLQRNHDDFITGHFGT